MMPAIAAPMKRAAADGCDDGAALKKAKPAAAVPVAAAAPSTATPTWPVAGSLPAGVPGWTYPALPPMGMMPPMSYCMPGNPFFPFMGMFPPFWLPAMAASGLPAAMAAAMTGAASAPGVAAMAAPAPAVAPAGFGVWPGAAQPCFSAPAMHAAAAPVSVSAARTSSGVSAAAFPSTSCTNSVPTACGFTPSPASPPPVASPRSVCNGSSSEQSAEDDDFAVFINDFFSAGDSNVSSSDTAGPGPKVFHKKDADAAADSTSGDASDEEACLTRSDSLLNLLGADFDLPASDAAMWH